MTPLRVVLSRPSVDLLASYLEFIEELRQHGDRIWETMVPAAGESGSQFVAGLVQAETAAEPPLTTKTTYWATVEGTVVGRGVLRHELTEALAEFGGHVSYEVRPSFRRKGLATELLRQILSTEKAKEIGTLLLTCDPTNLPSNKVIRANGGQFVKTAFVKRIQRETNSYRVAVKPGPG